MFVINDQILAFEPQVQTGLRLMADRVRILPEPALIEGVFEEAGIDLIWIPPPVAQVTPPEAHWTEFGKQRVSLAEKIVGYEILKDMHDTDCPFIQQIFEDGSQVVLFKKDMRAGALKILGNPVVLV